MLQREVKDTANTPLMCCGLSMKLFISAIITLQLACATGHVRQSAETQKVVDAGKAATSTFNRQPTPSAEISNSQDDSIRKVDFSNFTYNWYPDWGDIPVEGKKIVLREGEMNMDVSSGVNAPRGFFLADLNYGDLTGDNMEEAIVTLGIWSTGTARHHAIFVYTRTHKLPKMLWIYETGDRAYGGYRRAYVENNQLVVELYKPFTKIVEGEEITLPSSSTSTRDYYQWSGINFKRIKTEEFPNTPEEGKPWVVSRAQSKSP